uniref:CCHC-type domain-containing protein n=1 Tax=Cannabis sativa TaxID=3483 RepID=A0A803Q952_CANSA
MRIILDLNNLAVKIDDEDEAIILRLRKEDEEEENNGEGLLTVKGNFPKREYKGNEKSNGYKCNHSRSRSRNSIRGPSSNGVAGKQCYYCKKEDHFRDDCLALKAKLKR